jgi:hypothetical protein
MVDGVNITPPAFIPFIKNHKKQHSPRIAKNFELGKAKCRASFKFWLS